MMRLREVEDELAKEEAKTRSRRKVVELWEAELTLSKDGKGYAKTLRNIALVLANAAEFRAAIAFDDFAQRLVSTRATPAGPAGPWSDDHDLQATVWLQGSRWKLDAGDDLVARAVRAVAARQRVHPLRDRLNSLRWDGVPRVDTWLTTYLGADDTAVHRAIGAKWMLSAVARAFNPGCKVDGVLILEGVQGRGKSTALRILSLGFFADELADIGGKDAAMQLQGAWIHEFAELDAIGKAEASRVKSFITRSTDRFRPPWGRHVVELPRQCVFAGTVNHDDYLKDETGGRRFLPVRIRQLNLPDLTRDVEQLWAEAVIRYRNGERTYITDEALNALLRDHTSERYQADVWHSIVDEYAQVRGSVSVGECLEHVGVKRDRWTPGEQARIARCLKALGYVRKQIRVGGSRQWRYFRPDHHSVTGSSEGGGDTRDIGISPSVTTVTTVTSSRERDGAEGAQGVNQSHQVTPVTVVTPLSDWLSAHGVRHDPSEG